MLGIYSIKIKVTHMVIICVLLAITGIEFCYTSTDVPYVVKSNFNNVKIGDSFPIVTSKIGLPPSLWHLAPLEQQNALKHFEYNDLLGPKQYEIYYSIPGKFAKYYIRYRIVYSDGKVLETDISWQDS